MCIEIMDFSTKAVETALRFMHSGRLSIHVDELRNKLAAPNVSLSRTGYYSKKQRVCWPPPEERGNLAPPSTTSSSTVSAPSG